MADALHMEFSARQTPEALVRKVRCKQDSGGPGTEVTYEIVDDSVQESPHVLDGYLFGLLLHVMGIGLPLHVHGPVSRTAMYNLESVQAFWRLWRPTRYKHIDIIPDQIVDLERRKTGRRAIAAFSGGVDSTFTVLRHGTHPAGTEAYNLDTALMVHGFDINLANRDAFDLANKRATPFLNKMGVTLRIIRTNIKELGLQNWEDSHAGQLASCLHQFSDEFEFGLIASSGSYLDAELPYGSNPVLDHLYSGDEFGIIYDAAGYPKPEKIAAIAGDLVATAGLRVCWQGRDQWRNCGRCGKCIRTWLVLMMSGVPEPSCFDGTFDATAIEAMRIQNIAVWNRVKEVADYAAKLGVKAAWLRRLHRRISAYRRKQAADALAANLARALDRVGLKQIVKQGLRGFASGSRDSVLR